MTFDSEFKQALQQLPSKEKDKLILRLLKRDLNLASKLRFELVDTDSVLDKREQLQGWITMEMKRVTNEYYSAGCLLMDVRNISGRITEHVYITNDKPGEIILNCLMIRLLLELNSNRIVNEKKGKVYSLCIYLLNRIFKILILIQKQHEDLYMEFRDDVEAIGRMVDGNSSLSQMAKYNGLDISWLVRFEIPNDIAEIYKDLRQRGLLK
ncbi:hypothetical protein [Alistipes sp. ZOR0009]|uniref:hypothetical protein n=1 Tax=Alistipes sp. ZOR0009 TaxID=1339253 RepID=UPI0006485C2F|nr:hypothetical protein [Alistipes sp. ZOR0009]